MNNTHDTIDEGLLEVVQWIGRALLHRLRQRLHLQGIDLQGGKNVF